MRLSILFLLVLVCYDISTTTATMDTPSTLSACFNERYVHNYGDAVRRRTFLNKGITYKVFGLTSFCYVYAGWLHSVMDENRFPSGLEGNPINTTITACKDKQIVQMVTEGTFETVLLVIDRFGRRIRVQSAANSQMVGTIKGMLWLKFAPYDRRQQFYTNNIDKGFVIQSILKSRARVFVLCTSYKETRLYELKVILYNNQLKPYLKINSAVKIDPSLVTPTIGLEAVGQHDLYMNGRTQVPIIKRKNGQKVYMGTEFAGVTSTGLSFIHKSNAVNPMSNVSPTLPWQSLLTGSGLGYHGGYSFDGRTLFEGFNGMVVMLPTNDDECAGVIGRMKMYKHLLTGSNLRYNQEDPQTVLYAVSKRYYINRLQHRRMSYPHAYNRNKDRHILDVGWADSAPVLFGTIGVIILVGAVIKIIMKRKEKEEHRKGVTTSLSNAYSL